MTIKKPSVWGPVALGGLEIKISVRKPRQCRTSCGCYVSVLTGSTSPHSVTPDGGQLREVSGKGKDLFVGIIRR